MSNERVDELAKETLEDTTPTNPEEITEPVETPEVDPPEPTGEGEDLQSKLDDYDRRLKKAEEVNQNYKRELEKYRKKGVTETVDKPLEETSIEEAKIRDNYLSKKQDVLDEFGNELMGLSETEYTKVKSLLSAATRNVYDEAVKQKRYVAQGELHKTVRELIDYAKGQPKPVDKEELRKAESAEISAVKPKSPQGAGVTAQDRAQAEQTGRTPEREKEIRELREARLKDYQV